MIRAARVDLLWMGANPLAWPLGEVHQVTATPRGLASGIAHVLDDSAALVLWDESLGAPHPEQVRSLLRGPADVWHAGLRLGLAGLPRLLDFVAPTWPLTLDPDPCIDATSWRVSLGACLLRTDVVRQLGGPSPVLETLEGSGLEWGHRLIRQGAIVRHVPDLVRSDRPSRELPLLDELRFLRRRFGDVWLRWALVRAIASGWSPRALLQAWSKLPSTPPPPDPPPLRHSWPRPHPDELARVSVTVLIPTLDRNPFLRKVLGYLSRQTVKPHQVVVVDQTPRERRELDLAGSFPDLPLLVLHQDRPGQCTARNEGLERSDGDYVLFIDDDIDFEPDLIQRHLERLLGIPCQVSSGGIDEPSSGPPPEGFGHERVSDGFPTCNSMVRRSILARSGLFDLAYDHGSRADADLGIRIYRSGALMLHDPSIRVFHHRAPQGGLRSHGARRITYGSSRRYLTHRHLPSATEVYLAERYFSPRQVREMLTLRVAGTLAARGNALRRAAKVAVGLAMLPDTLLRTRRSQRAAGLLLARFGGGPP